MTKADLKFLERIFTAEIEGRLPFQSKSKQLPRLEREGLVEPMTRSFGTDRFGTITAMGWTLTHAGRLAYCESCADLSGEGPTGCMDDGDELSQAMRGMTQQNLNRVLDETFSAPEPETERECTHPGAHTSWCDYGRAKPSAG